MADIAKPKRERGRVRKKRYREYAAKTECRKVADFLNYDDEEAGFRHVDLIIRKHPIVCETEEYRVARVRVLNCTLTTIKGSDFSARGKYEERSARKHTADKLNPWYNGADVLSNIFD